jgi:rhomboid family GlyGly-CTERM serine protease
MGLRERGDALIPALGRFAPAIGVILIALVLELGGEPVRGLLRYDRSGFGSGEVWRALTAHFVHLGPSHLMMNAIGTVLVAVLVLRVFPLRRWAFVTIVVIGSIVPGLWLFNPELQWYVGLSGLLHGWLAAGIVGLIRDGSPDGWLLALVLAGKLVIEQWYGTLPGSSEVAGGPVVVDAHLYGAVAGAAAGMVLTRLARPRSL